MVSSSKVGWPQSAQVAKATSLRYACNLEHARDAPKLLQNSKLPPKIRVCCGSCVWKHRWGKLGLNEIGVIILTHHILLLSYLFSEATKLYICTWFRDVPKTWNLGCNNGSSALPRQISFWSV